MKLVDKLAVGEACQRLQKYSSNYHVHPNHWSEELDIVALDVLNKWELSSKDAKRSVSCKVLVLNGSSEADIPRATESLATQLSSNHALRRSEERSVGKEGVSKCRSRW